MTSKNINKSATLVSLDELKEELLDSWNLEYSVLVMGPAGVGKSSVFKQVLAEVATGDPFAEYRFNKTAGMYVVGGEKSDGTPEGDAREIATSFGFIDMRLSQVEPQDLAGIPMPENGVTIRHLPNDMPVVGAKHIPENGLLLLDEVNQADMAVQKAMFSIVLDHKIDNKPFKSGWKVMAAGNRVEDSIAVSELCEPLKNRFAHYEVYADYNPFKKWAIHEGVDPLIITYLKTQASDICHTSSDNSEYAFPTPRTWKQVSDKIKHWRENGFKRGGRTMSYKTKLRGIAALIGTATAAKFVAHMDMVESLNVENYLSGKEEKVFVQSEINEAWAMMSALYSYVLHGGDNNKSDDISKNKAEACVKVVEYIATFNPFEKLKELTQCLFEDLSAYDKDAFKNAIKSLDKVLLKKVYDHIKVLI